MSRRWLPLLVLLLAPLRQAAAQDIARHAQPWGLWLTQTRDGVIEVYRCGPPGELCARVAGMEYADAMPTDIWHRPKCELGLMTYMQPQDDGTWSGRILDPDAGKTYAANVWMTPAGEFKLHGYIGLPIFGETQTWTRFHGKLGPACHLAASQAR